MAKYFRLPFGVNGDRTAIPDDLQPSGVVSYDQGYTFDYQRDPETDIDAKNIERDKQNSLFYDITEAIQQYQQFSVPDFITAADNDGVDFPYSQFARVRYDDGSGFKVYESLIDANVDLPTVALSWAEVSATQGISYGTTTNVSNAYTVTLSPAITALSQSALYIVKFNAGNTGAATLNPNAIGATALRTPNGSALPSGFIVANTYYLLVYDGTNLIMIGASGDTSPVGSVITHAANSAPTGFLECNGAAISRTTYASLFAAIGTVFGVGDGSTTFNIPDLRGEFVRGWDNGRGVDTGRVFGSSQLDAFQGFSPVASIAYSNSGGGSPGLGNAAGNTYYNAGGGTVPTPIQWDATAAANDSFALAKGYIVADGTNGTPRVATETRGRNVALMYCIKY